MARRSRPQPHEEGIQVAAAAEVLHALFKAARYIGRTFNARLAGQDIPLKLSGPGLRLLLTVAAAGRIRMTDLAVQLCITPRTVTSLVDTLEQDGLLARLPDPTDRRAILLEVTAATRPQCVRVRALQTELSEELLAPLDDGQRRQLLDLLTRLTAGGSSEAACDWESCG